LFKQKKILNISIHIAVWICFFLLPYIFSPQPKDISVQVSKYLVVLYIVINIFLLLFYYFNTLVLIPKLLFKKRWFIYSVIISIFFIAYLYVPKEIAFLINGQSKETLQEQFIEERNQREAIIEKNTTDANTQQLKPKIKTIVYFPGSFAVFFLILTIGICSKAIGQWMSFERTKQQIAHQKVNAELSYLKSQVNPHFFFNTLNNIYSLAVVQSDKTAASVLKLSSIMRYMLTEVQEEKTLLEKEIDHIKNYIDLQMVRLTNKVSVSFTVNGTIDGIKVAPLLLIPFIENAFKYGVSTVEQSAIEIEINTTEKCLQFISSNTIVQTQNILQSSTGIGISNVKRRLELLYKDNYTLNITNNTFNFKVFLEINI